MNGLVLFTAERLRRRETQRVEPVSVSSRTSSRSAQEPQEPAPNPTNSDAGIAAALSWKQALGIGAAQAAALVPGISRSGSSMVGGLLSGLNNENAARFSFLLATPVIGAAAVLKLPELLSPDMTDLRGVFLVGALCSAVAAWVATKFLLRFFETKTLTPFAVYCMAGGGVYFSAMLVLG